MSRIGYVFEELYMWHNPGVMPGPKYLEPTEHWENHETKRRLNNLVGVSGLDEHVSRIRARPASRDEITRFHTPEYHDKIVAMSEDRGGNAGEIAYFSAGGYEIAALSAGGVLVAIEAVAAGTISSAYCLVRPPGHHAERDRGMGFCLFNNIALAALHARTLSCTPKMQKIAIVDYDVHHGNGTQQAFWNDPDCLFISLHQDSNYPIGTGNVDEVGGEGAIGTTINIPLPPGSGSGAYKYAFETVVLPAIDRFQPDLILVSSGFDGSFTDHLAAMMLTSEDYRYFTRTLKAAAERWCQGRLIFAHEGGYSKDYVPYCGLAVLEELTGHRTEVYDHNLEDINQWGYQDLQPHQKALVDRVALLHNLSSLLVPPTLSSEEEKNLFLHVQAVLDKADPEQKKAILNALLTQMSSY
jgi:acetoin utilization deacetylase AcuC-like enzyme